MGKGSAPEYPTPPSAAELAAATAETAEHYARLKRAMEFGEEMLLHSEEEDGTTIRHERVKTDIPTGYEPQYSEQEIKVSGPQSFKGVQINAKGELESKVPKFKYKNEQHRWTDQPEIPAGTHWSDLATFAGQEGGGEFVGQQMMPQMVRTLTGYKSPTGEVVNANQYYKVTRKPDGSTTREVVERDAAIDVDFSGMGDTDRALKRWEFEKETSGDVADHLLRMAKEKGLDDPDFKGGFIDTAVEMIRRTDPIGKRIRDMTGEWAEQAKEEGIETLPNLGEMATLLGPESLAVLQSEVPGLRGIDLEKELPEYTAELPKFGAAPDVLGRLGAAPTTEELAKGAAPKFGEIGAMGDLVGAPTAPGFGEFAGKVPGLERAGEMAGLGRIGAEPTLREMEAGPGFAGPEGMAALDRMAAAPGLEELEGGPALERAGELERLERLKRFGGYERAGELGALERAGDMAALERRGAAPTLEELERGPALERAGEMDELQRLASFGGLERAGRMGELERAGGMDALERAGRVPDLERLAIEELELDPETLARRRYAEERLAERAQDPETSRLMADEARRIARGRGAATGNIFGGGAVIEEARAVRMAEEGERRRARDEYMRFMQSGQTAADYEAQISAENLRRRAMGIGQRGAAAQAEFGMGMQRLGADREAALQERADELGSIAQRNQAEETEYQAAMRTLDANRQAVVQEYGLESQRRSFANEQSLRERADELAAVGQRTGAQQAEYQNLQNQLTQINMARQQQFGMGGETLMANRQAQMQEQASRMETMGQRTTAQQQEFQAGLQAMDQRTAAAGGEYGFEAQRVDQQNEARLREQAGRLESIASRTSAQQAEYENLQAQLNQINAARQAQFGMGGEALMSNRQAQLQERADELSVMDRLTENQQREYQNLQSQIAQINETRQAQFGMRAQGLGMDQQATLAERGAYMEGVGQRTGAQAQEYGFEMGRLDQQQRAREAGFQANIQAAGFENEATLRKRADELGAIAQKTSQQQQEFTNLAQIVSQINQARGGQFGMQAQQLEINTQQQMRERADELAVVAQRNQAQEAEYQDLLAGLSQQERSTQAQFGMEQSRLEQQQAYGQRQDQQTQQAFAGAMQKTMSEEQLKQQQMANLQSFSGLAPVSGQFGMLPGAQQAAASTFTPLQYQPTNAMALLQGQQQMAASTFGTQANIYGTQAKMAMQPSGVGQALGAVAGGFSGGAGAAWMKSLV